MSSAAFSIGAAAAGGLGVPSIVWMVLAVVAVLLLMWAAALAAKDWTVMSAAEAVTSVARQHMGAVATSISRRETIALLVREGEGLKDDVPEEQDSRALFAHAVRVEDWARAAGKAVAGTGVNWPRYEQLTHGQGTIGGERVADPDTMKTYIDVRTAALVSAWSRSQDY